MSDRGFFEELLDDPFVQGVGLLGAIIGSVYGYSLHGFGGAFLWFIIGGVVGSIAGVFFVILLPILFIYGIYWLFTDGWDNWL